LIYCDNTVVSRWEKTASGTIEYRWYTALSTIWKPIEDIEGKITGYEFEKFVCENGLQKMVDKEKTSYGVYVTKDGTEIKIEY